MDYNGIRKLLEKYWAAETDVSEEKILKDFFISHTDIPDDLLTEKHLFLTFHEESTSPVLNEDLSIKLRSHLRKNTIPLWKTALKYAAVLLVISITGYFLLPNKRNKADRSIVIEQTIKDEKEAMKEVNTALMMLSENMKDGLENVKQLEILKELGDGIQNKTGKKIIR
jgi:hypothetical protein